MHMYLLIRPPIYPFIYLSSVIVDALFQALLAKPPCSLVTYYHLAQTFYL